MAIVEMKRVRLLGMNADKDKLLRAMQRAGCVEITAVEGDVDAFRGSGKGELERVDDQLARIRWAISTLGRYDTEKRGMLASMSMPTVTETELQAVAGEQDRLMSVIEAAEACERRSGDLRGIEARNRAQVEQLLPWRALDIPVERIQDTRATVQFIGTVNNREYAGLEAALKELPASLEHIGDERENMFIWVAAHRSAKESVQAALKAADYAAVQFTGETGTVAQMLDALRVQLNELQGERGKLEDELKALAVDVPKLKLLYEVVVAEHDREEASANFAVTGSTFLMEGWAPAPAVEKLEKKLHASAKDVAVEFRDPTEDEKPPTLLHNNRTFAPFETIVTSYSYPDPHGFDPTVVMAPFFACLFGMMLSDAGYGAMLVIAIPLILHFVKPKQGMANLMKILFFGGIFTVIWGTVFNTWFGTNPSFMPMLVDMLNNPIPVLAICIGMGALHLFVGLGVAAYMNIKRGKPLDAVFDQLSWFVLVLGLPLMLLPQTATVGKWMAIIGALTIFLFAGRDNPKIVGRLISGGGALYGVSSWLSDLLSYMRLFGMGLATGVIGMVFNMLAGLVMGNGIIGIILGIALMVVGHVFNFAINALGAYVHSCRLQYIEFFSKFYEDGGVPFSPLAQKPLYAAVVDNTDGMKS